MGGPLGNDLQHVGVEIKNLESKQERVEAALEGRGSYLGTTCHVSARTGVPLTHRPLLVLMFLGIFSMYTVLWLVFVGCM